MRTALRRPGRLAVPFFGENVWPSHGISVCYARLAVRVSRRCLGKKILISYSVERSEAENKDCNWFNIIDFKFYGTFKLVY